MYLIEAQCPILRIMTLAGIWKILYVMKNYGGDAVAIIGLVHIQIILYSGISLLDVYIMRLEVLVICTSHSGSSQM